MDTILKLILSRLAIRPVALFAFYVDIKHCLEVVLTAFDKCACVKDVVEHFDHMSALEQGGLYLYTGILVMSLMGAIALGFYYVRKLTDAVVRACKTMFPPK